MIQLFTGDDRVRASREIAQILGSDYETVEGASLDPAALPSLFFGASLFTESRNILIRDLSANKAVWDKLPEYLDTPHNIIIQELKIDKRSSTYKTLKASITIKEFNLPVNPNYRLVFDVYTTAKRDGKRAVAMLEQVKQTEDPIMFFGLLVSGAIKDYKQNQGTKEKKALKELSRLDLQLKSTSTSPWLLIEAFLIKLASLS